MAPAREASAAGSVLAALLLTPVSSPAQVGGGGAGPVWDSIGVMPDSQLVFIHTRSFERASETALRVWTRTRSNRSRELYGIEYDRMLLQVEFDCADGAIHFIWMNLYHNDRLVQSDRLEGRSDPLAEEVYGEMLKRSICTDSEPDPG